MKPNTPRQKRMNRQGRVQSARTWINSYTGKNIVRGYSKRYGVDLLCAVKELEILGVKTEKKYIEQLKNQQKAHIKMKEKRKRKEDLDYAIFLLSRTAVITSLLGTLLTDLLVALPGKNMRK